jgi:hypothetical protein
MRTSSHHQPEAQHPKSPAIETPAGRLPHLLALSVISLRRKIWSLMALSGQPASSAIWSLTDQSGHSPALTLNLSVANDPKRTLLQSELQVSSQDSWR